VTTTYRVQAIHVDQLALVEQLDQAIQREVQALGLHHSIEVAIGTDPPAGEPGVAVYFASALALADAGCTALAAASIADAVVVFPVVESLDRYEDQVPDVLRPINACEWSGTAPAERIAHVLLEELGIEERQRRVFISHKRDDGLFAAEQLHESLSRYRFRPFIDRFDIAPGVEVQARIADALEEYAFLLLLETPLAHESKWVFDEVDYALSHTMGLHIVRWPGDLTPIPATDGLHRQHLGVADLTTIKGYDALTDASLDSIVGEVEAAHARAMVRRRRNLLRSVEETAEDQGCTCTPSPGWRLLVERDGDRDVVQLATRLPLVDDLHDLDVARTQSAGGRGILVHASRTLRDERRDLLTWAAGSRPLALVPETAIGGYW
jgi:hypothetical protein